MRLGIPHVTKLHQGYDVCWKNQTHVSRDKTEVIIIIGKLDDGGLLRSGQKSIPTKSILMVHFSSSSVNLFSAKSARVILQRNSIYNTMLEKQVIKSKKNKVPKFREMKHISRKAYLYSVESEGGGST